MSDDSGSRQDFEQASLPIDFSAMSLSEKVETALGEGSYFFAKSWARIKGWEELFNVSEEVAEAEMRQAVEEGLIEEGVFAGSLGGGLPPMVLPASYVDQDILVSDLDPFADEMVLDQTVGISSFHARRVLSKPFFVGELPIIKRAQEAYGGSVSAKTYSEWHDEFSPEEAARRLTHLASRGHLEEIETGVYRVVDKEPAPTPSVEPD